MGIGLGGFDLKRRKARAGRQMRKNDEAETATANALSAPVASLGEGKGDGKDGSAVKRFTYDICINCQRALEEGVTYCKYSNFIIGL
ncbi:UNVERIFIED_CONTAM: hypothetical protein Sradi_4390900 [Sesamum radiatum]|uniref:FLZ-type domain-containing protein n=1 Tax=Sesamum radiatum TaxID=300843 RepID=A0AAW2NSV0_SESRA